MKLTKPTAGTLNDLDMDNEYDELPKCFEPGSVGWCFFKYPAGMQHYRLLKWLGQQFDGKTIFDIGTNRGASAIALASNRRNCVVTYDVQCYDNTFVFPANVIPKIISPYEIPKLGCDVIFYDTMHNGVDERRFMSEIESHGWKGLVLFDDIGFTDEMKDFWESLKYRKEDWTDVGHDFGTGVVFVE